MFYSDTKRRWNTATVEVSRLRCLTRSSTLYFNTGTPSRLCLGVDAEQKKMKKKNKNTKYPTSRLRCATRLQRKNVLSIGVSIDVEAVSLVEHDVARGYMQNGQADRQRPQAAVVSRVTSC